MNEDGRTVFQTNSGYFISVTGLDNNNDLGDNVSEKFNTVRSKLGLGENFLIFTVGNLLLERATVLMRC